MKSNIEHMEPLNYKRSSRVWAGLFLVAAGLLLLAYQMGAPVPAWIISWPVALIAIGVLISIRHRFKSVAGFILIFIGVFNLIDQFMPELNFRTYSLPIIIIAIGLFFILRPKRRWRHRHNWIDDNQTGDTKNEWKSTTDKIAPYSTKYDGADYIDSTAILGGVKKVIVSKNFKGGDITCFMGGAEIDLTQADIQNNVVLDITAVFGGCKLIVPANWDVKSEATAVFGGIDDKRAVNASNLTAGKVLILQGTVVFGGIDIRSY
jgi:predicted membrane protein